MCRNHLLRNVFQNVETQEYLIGYYFLYLCIILYAIKNSIF